MTKKNIRKLVLLILFILASIQIGFVGGTVSYALFFAILTIPLISLMYLAYVFYSFSIYQNLSSRNITVGELVPYSFIIKNEGYTVFTAVNIKVFTDFSYVTDVPDDQLFRVFPGEKIKYDTSLICRYRGEYKVGVNRIILTDFFGLFSFSYRMLSSFEVIVKPRIMNLEIHKDIPDLDVYIQSNMKSEINEPDLIVRNYINGDSLKKIHWKSTARTMELKVRNDIGILKEKVLLLADFERVSDNIHEFLPLENKILEQTIGLLYHFVLDKIPIEFVYGKDKMQSTLISDVSHFNYVYDELSAINFYGLEADVRNKQFVNLFEEVQHRGLINDAKIVLMVIHYIDDELFALLAKLSQTSKVTVAYIITEKDISTYSRQNTDRFKIIKVGIE